MLKTIHMLYVDSDNEIMLTIHCKHSFNSFYFYYLSATPLTMALATQQAKAIEGQNVYIYIYIYIYITHFRCPYVYLYRLSAWQ